MESFHNILHSNTTLQDLHHQAILDRDGNDGFYVYTHSMGKSSPDWEGVTKI